MNHSKMEQRFFVKSFEEDFCTKTMIGKIKTNCQSVEEICRIKIIKPNTISFGKEKRLSCTILHKSYLKTYRPQGIIFTAKQNPDYIFPFDLSVLGATSKIIVHYYRIKNNLDIYYNQPLIKGFEKFVFKDFESLIKIIKSPEHAWIEVNRFRKSMGFEPLAKSKRRLVEYNEAVFHTPVNIEPVAIFGYKKSSKIKAKSLNLPHFRSAKEFFLKTRKNERK